MEDTYSYNHKLSNLLLSAVRQREIRRLKRLLPVIKYPELYLNKIYDEPHQQKCTLLMIACANQYVDVIRLLLKYPHIDLEVLNDIELIDKDGNSTMFFDVTVLWASAALNNFSMIKLFIQHGAHINHRTKTNSTAFRCACCNSNIEIIRYLAMNGADVRISKDRNETNLIAAVYNKSLLTTKYLVNELGCDVNECMDDGRSPLSIAVDRGSFELVKFLFDHGARNDRSNLDRMSPIMVAAENQRIDIVDILYADCSRIEQIEVEELIGTTFICEEHESHSLEKAIEYFHRAFELRSKYDIPKTINLSKLEVFDYHHECQTVDELEKVKFNYDHIYIEALLIRERLLGQKNEKYLYSLQYRGGTLAINRQYHQGILFWLYELNLRRTHSLFIKSEDLRQWASIFSDIIHVNFSFPVLAWSTVITVLMDELENNKIDFDYNLHTLLFLITIASQILSNNDISILDRSICNSYIYKIIRNRYTTRYFASSLLHLCLRPMSLVHNYLINLICNYPCLSTATTLIKFGTDVDSVDAAGDTPLHVYVSNTNMNDIRIIELLSNAGAHLDCVNTLRKMPIDVASDISVKQYLKSKMKLCLKCLCAKVIQTNHISYHDKIPISLVKFIEKH